MQADIGRDDRISVEHRVELVERGLPLVRGAGDDRVLIERVFPILAHHAERSGAGPSAADEPLRVTRASAQMAISGVTSLPSSDGSAST